MDGNSQKEDEVELQEMREWFRQVRAGGKFAIWIFSLLMAVGGGYLMVKSIINIK